MPVLTVGDHFPEYQMQAVKPGDLAYVDAYNADDYFMTATSAKAAGKWRVVFFWPKNFSFVCPTEITAFAGLYAEFQRRDCEVLGVTTDNEYSTYAWRRSHSELQQVPFPLGADVKHDLARSCGVLNDEGVCDRATFIIDPENVIRYVSVSDSAVGRSIAETLRQLDALQTGALCMADWREGMPIIDEMEVMRQS